ncbi:MAG: hypothetical protein HY554_09085 [Elusimicrobia bacterium]|nr:hypothetical protein [Elusimicrobiota bacterium]
MARLDTLKEIWEFAKNNKRYWVAPFVIVLALFGLILIFAETSVVAPFIYTLF